MIEILAILSTLAIGVYIGETIAERHQKRHTDKLIQTIKDYFSSHEKK